MSEYKVPDPAEFDTYDTGQFVPPPQPKEKNDKGKFAYVIFTATAPGLKGIETRNENDKFLTTKEGGYLKAVVRDLRLNDSGYVIQQSHVSSKQYNKRDKDGNITGTRAASPAMDYFRAFGLDIKPASGEDYEALFQQTAGNVAQVTIDWSAYDSDTDTNVADKWEDFPLVAVEDDKGRGYVSQEAAEAAGATGITDVSAEGRRMPFIEKNGKRFWARASVKRWVSAV